MTLRWTLVLILLAGCSFDSAAPLQTIDNTCGSDADCAEGQCDGSICIDDSAASVEVVIEVVNTAAEAEPTIPASWTFPSERFSGYNARNLELPATREVQGKVRWGAERVPATLRFSRRMPDSVAPLQPVAVGVDTFREPAGGEEPDAYDFTTVLVAGETYDVFVLPTSDMLVSPGDVSAPAIRSLPPLYLELSIDDGDSADPQRFDMCLPDNLDVSCTSERSSACTLEADVASYDGEVPLAEAGLQVRAVDQVTGLVVSSIAETNAWGTFAIRVGEQTSDYRIRVTSNPGAEPFPAISVDPEILFSAEPGERVIYVPRLSRILYTGRVRDERGAPVPNATLRFMSSSVFDDTQLGLQGSFSGSATTNEEGSFGAELLPGFYAITVIPPDDFERPWGTLATEALVGEDSNESEDLVLPPRVELLGSLTTFEDEVAAGVTVLARARQDDPLSSLQRSQEVGSSALGRFTLRLDRGLYDVLVKVPSERGYAWIVEPELLMDADLARDYRFEPPIPVEGVVEASDGAPVPGALVRAYVLTDEGEGSRSIQVGETVSDEAGNYRLLIAPRFDAE